MRLRTDVEIVEREWAYPTKTYAALVSTSCLALSGAVKVKFFEKGVPKCLMIPPW